MSSIDSKHAAIPAAVEIRQQALVSSSATVPSILDSFGISWLQLGGGGGCDCITDH